MPGLETLGQHRGEIATPRCICMNDEGKTLLLVFVAELYNASKRVNAAFLSGTYNGDDCVNSLLVLETTFQMLV